MRENRKKTDRENNEAKYNIILIAFLKCILYFENSASKHVIFGIMRTAFQNNCISSNAISKVLRTENKNINRECKLKIKTKDLFHYQCIHYQCRMRFLISCNHDTKLKVDI